MTYNSTTVNSFLFAVPKRCDYSCNFIAKEVEAHSQPLGQTKLKSDQPKKVMNEKEKKKEDERGGGSKCVWERWERVGKNGEQGLGWSHGQREVAFAPASSQ